MPFEVETPTETQARVRVRVPRKAIDDALAHELGHMQERARVPGFRPGRVPKQLLEKKYGDSLVKEVRRRLIVEAIEEGIAERKLHPVDPPSIQDADLEPKEDGSLAVDLEFEVIPHVEPAALDRFTVTLPAIDVNETEVMQELEGLRRQAARADEVADGQVAAGDIVIADLTLQFLDGSELPTFESRIVDTGAGLVDGVACEEAKARFVGCRRGDAIKLSMKLPEQFPIEEHRGKTAVTTCTVKDARRFTLLELEDPAFPARFGVKDLEELKAKVRDRVRQLKRGEQERALEERCVDELLERNRFALPAAFLERRIEAAREQSRRELAERGVPQEQIETQLLEHDGRLKAEVERHLRETYLLDRVAEKLAVEVSVQELEQQVVLLARAWQVEPQKLFEEFQSKGLIPGVVNDIRRRKVRRQLREAATATENVGETSSAETTASENAK